MRYPPIAIRYRHSGALLLAKKIVFKSGRRQEQKYSLGKFDFSVVIHSSLFTRYFENYIFLGLANKATSFRKRKEYLDILNYTKWLIAELVVVPAVGRR